MLHIITSESSNNNIISNNFSYNLFVPFPTLNFSSNLNVRKFLLAFK